MKDRQYVIGATGSGLQVEVAQSQSIAQNDTRVSLSYRIPLNADFSSAVRNSPAQAALPSARVSPDAPYAGKSYLYSEFIQANPDWVPMPGSRPIVPSNTVRYAFDLLKETKARPNFIPTQVDAIIDPTAKPTLLVAVDWTVLPKESKVDITTGITTIALPSVPGELISALLNKSQDVRSAFSLAGNGLVFNPRLLESVLSSGTNTVEIETTNHFITLTLQKGSVVLTGVNILTKQADAPTTANDPTISNITQTSANATVNISDINGVRNLSCQLQTAAGVNV